MSDQPTANEIAMIQQRMLKLATQHLIDQGVSPTEAKVRAFAALNAPSRFRLPTIDELDG
jgi:hypothetical protein